MKHREDVPTVEAYPHVLTRPYYELEIWEKKTELSEKEAMKVLYERGYIPRDISRRYVGVFPTRQEALRGIEEITDTYADIIECSYACVFLREKPLNVMIPSDGYIKEWTYQHGLLVDESLVRNYKPNDMTHSYSSDANPFLGRPMAMVRFSVGDIVWVVFEDVAFWGIVANLPPSVGEYDPNYLIDDVYVVCSAPGHLYHVAAHHVFKPYFFPKYVEDYLTLSDDLIEYLRLPQELTGLPFDIMVDDSGAYQRHSHPLYAYVRDGISKHAPFVPIVVGEKVSTLRQPRIISDDDIDNILSFIQSNAKLLKDLADDKIKQLEFFDTIKPFDH